jgi:hypothetical protein
MTLSFDPSSSRADFASVAFYEDGEIQFGSSPDAAASAALTTGPFMFTAAARASKVTLYAQHPVQLYGVFEPFDSTPLEPEVQSDSAIVAYPSSWRTGTGPKLLSLRPSTLRCQDLGVTATKFAPTPEPKGVSLGVDMGSFRLRAVPGGPPVVELPPDSTVSVSRYNAHVARVEYRTSEGIYRGFEAMSRLSPGSGGTSGSHVRVRPARPTTTPCQESPTLYLVHADDRVMEVGKIKPGRAFQYEGTPFTISTPSGPRSLVQVTSEWVEMASGFSLAVDAPGPGSCLPLRSGTEGARVADPPR